MLSSYNDSLTLVLAGALTAWLSVMLLVPLLRPFAIRIGLVDRPQGRKQHHGDVPLIGGLVIFLGYVASLLVMGQIELWRGPIFWAWLVLLCVGLWDDLGGLRVWLRVLIQVSAIILLCSYTGMRLEHLGYLTGDEPLILGRYALPVTILGLIGIKNGINLIDGLDGLAATQVLVMLFWFIILSLQNGVFSLILLCAPLAGAVLGFLVFNLRFPGRPAQIFLGDHGSVFLGFTLGWVAVVGSQIPTPAFAPIEAVWILGLPVLDTIRVMLNRMLRGLSPFTPGRDHLHHLLLDSGLTVNTVVLAMLVASITMGGVAWLGRLMECSEVFLFCIFLGLSAIFFLGAQHLDSRLRDRAFADR